MVTLAEALERASLLARAGQVPQAEQIYQEILRQKPEQPQVLWHWAQLANNTGRHALAADLLARALEADPNNAFVHAELARAYQSLGRTGDAVASYQRAISLRADFAVAHNNLGNIYRGHARLDEAQACYLEALRHDANLVDAHNNLGTVYRQRGQLVEAVACFERAISLEPTFAGAHMNLGNALQQQGRHADAIAAYERAREAGGDFPALWYHWGLALGQLDRPDEAQAAFQRAVDLDPRFAMAQNNLATAWQDRGDMVRAREHYQAAIAAAPDYAEPHYNLGTLASAEHDLALAERHYRAALAVDPAHVAARYNLAVTLARGGRDAEALQEYNAVLARAPDHADAHFGRGALWMRGGDFAAGWPELEWRTRSSTYLKRNFSQPLWDGSPIGEQTLLVHADEAVGDTFQFVRYLPLVAARCRRLLVEVAPAVIPFLRQGGLPGEFIARGQTLPAFDARVPLMSLPRVFGTTLDSIPAGAAYLAADSALVEQWRERLASLGGLRVGIGWQGRPTYVDDYGRSIPLAEFEPLARVKGVQLISLQKRVGTEQLAAARERFPITLLPDDVDEAAGFFMDTAAVMKNLDLVITSDTVTAHLAGGLGVPVWVALGFAAEWRWLQARDDSPWYPTMQLFRQRATGDWAELFTRMAASLSSLVESAGRR